MGIIDSLGRKGVPGFRSGKKWKMVVASVVYAYLGLFLLAFIFGPPPAESGGSGDIGDTTAQTQTPGTTDIAAAAPTTTQAPTPESTPTPTPIPATWHEVARWTGNGIKNTETFTIPEKEWRISWDTKPDSEYEFNFQIYVYNDAGTLKDVAANVIGADKDSTIIRGAGDYYLAINTAQPYTVIVEAKW